MERQGENNPPPRPEVSRLASSSRGIQTGSWELWTEEDCAGLSTSRADTQPDTCQTQRRQDKGARRTGAASLRPIGKAACRGQLRVHRAGSLAPERSPAVSPAPGFTLLWWVRG